MQFKLKIDSTTLCVFVFVFFVGVCVTTEGGWAEKQVAVSLVLFEWLKINLHK